MDDLEVKRFAVKYDPPTLVVEYKTSDGALFLKKIRIKVKAKMDAERLCDKIIERNTTLLGPDHVCRTQLMDLLNLLLQESANYPREEEKEKESASLSRVQIEEHKRTSQSVGSRSVTTEEKNVVGDVSAVDDNRSKSDRSWLQTGADVQPDNQSAIIKDTDLPIDDVEDLNEVNLNQYDDDALSKVKSKMDVKFDSNRITPDHPDFVWDKEVSFEGADEDCDWDEDEEDSD